MFTSIFDFLFGKKYGTGLVESPADSRNIDLASVQPPVSIPSFYMTDLSPFGVNDQGVVPSCVGHSFAKLAELYVYKRTGKIERFDAQKLYEQCKKEDGMPDVAGTYATIAAKIIIRDGIDQIGLDSNDKVATGYAFVAIDFDTICQAIYQNLAVTVGMQIDSNWFKGIIGRALKYIGGHQTDLHGYDQEKRYLYGINSWGINWIGRIAGIIDPNVKPGFYHANYDDIESAIMNVISLVQIPKAVIDDAKRTPYRFVTTMQIGTTSPEVKQLQIRLNVTPQTGYFGPLTKQAVVNYQIQNGLTPADGIVGPATRAKLNGGTKSFIPQWIAAITAMEGALKSRNNPGNLRFVGQKYAVNDNGFCKFDTFEHGYQALEALLVRACTGKSVPLYRPTMTLIDFYHVYAPSSDGNNPNNYANFVAKRLGVSPTITIAELL